MDVFAGILPRTSFCSFICMAGCWSLCVCLDSHPLFYCFFFWHMSSHMFMGGFCRKQAPLAFCYSRESLGENCIVLGVSGGVDADGTFWKVEWSFFVCFYDLINTEMHTKECYGYSI